MIYMLIIILDFQSDSFLNLIILNIPLNKCNAFIGSTLPKSDFMVLMSNGHPKSTAVAVFVLLSRTTFDPSILAEFTEPFGESDFDFFTVHKGFSEAG